MVDALLNGHKTAQNVSDLQVSTLAVSASSSAGSGSTGASVRHSHTFDPEPFAGDLGKCRGFIL